MVSCCVGGCKNRTSRQGPQKAPAEVSFHRLPADVRIRNKWESWLRKINGPEFAGHKEIRICSLHFANHCFVAPSLLKKSALPSIHIERKSKVKKTEKNESDKENVPPNVFEDVSPSMSSSECPRVESVCPSKSPSECPRVQSVYPSESPSECPVEFIPPTPNKETLMNLPSNISEDVCPYESPTECPQIEKEFSVEFIPPKPNEETLTSVPSNVSEDVCLNESPNECSVEFTPPKPNEGTLTYVPSNVSEDVCLYESLNECPESESECSVELIPPKSNEKTFTYSVTCPNCMFCFSHTVEKKFSCKELPIRVDPVIISSSTPVEVRNDDAAFNVSEYPLLLEKQVLSANETVPISLIPETSPSRTLELSENTESSSFNLNASGTTLPTFFPSSSGAASVSTNSPDCTPLKNLRKRPRTTRILPAQNRPKYWQLKALGARNRHFRSQRLSEPILINSFEEANLISQQQQQYKSNIEMLPVPATLQPPFDGTSELLTAPQVTPMNVITSQQTSVTQPVAVNVVPSVIPMIPSVTPLNFVASKEILVIEPISADVPVPLMNVTPSENHNNKQIAVDTTPSDTSTTLPAFSDVLAPDLTESVNHANQSQPSKMPTFQPPTTTTTEILRERIRHKNRQLKALRMRSCRSRGQLATYRNIIKALERKNFFGGQALEELREFGEVNKELLRRQIAKARNAKKKRVNAEYGEALRSFALTLNYYSPKAYQYVRQTFNNVLPHPRTLSAWYSKLDGKPGLTQEAFDTLKAANKGRQSKKENPIVGHLMLDEMNIFKQIEYDGTHYYGYVDNGMELGSNQKAGQALVFMFVSADEKWKLPLGYFMIHSLTGEMKENLLNQVLYALHESGTILLSVTFDGASNNLTMINNLGAKVHNPSDYDAMKTFFICPFSKRKIFIFYDICHMFKLVRNFLCDAKIFYDDQENLVEWAYFEDLLEVQELEGLHLANKVKTQHVHFKNHIMKVKLATQLLRESVAKAFEVLKKLDVKDFPNSGPTIRFVKMFNSLFDVFNSKPNISAGFKKAINPQNIDEFEPFLKDAYNYILELKDEEGFAIHQGTRKTGFLGFLISIKSLLEMYKYIFIDGEVTINEEKDDCQVEEVISVSLDSDNSVSEMNVMDELDVHMCSDSDTQGDVHMCSESDTHGEEVSGIDGKVTRSSLCNAPLLKEICTHRFCQDHLEIFFGIIRQHGGHRRNPTSRQFQAAYKKCLVHLQLKQVETGNCVSTEPISILSCSSTKAPVEDEAVTDDQDSDDEFIFDLSSANNVDHFYDFSSQELTIYTKNVVTYIAGSVIRSSNRALKCPACKEAMNQNPVTDYCLLIEERDSGGLIKPGHDTRQVSFVCEKLIRQVLASSGGRFIQPSYTTSKLSRIVSRAFGVGELEDMFSVLNSPSQDPQDIFRHKSDLVSSICKFYFNLRLHHISRKSHEAADNKRNFLNKLCDYSGT